MNEVHAVLPADLCHLSTSELMVIFLIAPLFDKGYFVYTDNWYTSIQLLVYLQQRNCTTVRDNRGVPAALQAADPGPGTFVTLCGDRQVLATKYHSTEMVYLLSSKIWTQ